MKNRSLMHRKKGFTLIELLVVVAIIALLLMAILIPALRALHTPGAQAQTIICRSHIKSLSQCWHVYATDNDGYLIGSHVDANVPYRWVSEPLDDNGNRTSRQVLRYKQNGIRAGLLWPYVDDMDVYHCPSDMRHKDASIRAWRSYSISAVMNEHGTASHPHANDTEVHRISEIRNPEEKFVLVEETDRKYGYNPGPWHMHAPPAGATPLSNASGLMWKDQFAIMHNTRSSIGFADGHAEIHRWVNPGTREMSKTPEGQGKWTGGGFPIDAGEDEDYWYCWNGYNARE